MSIGYISKPIGLLYVLLLLQLLSWQHLQRPHAYEVMQTRWLKQYSTCTYAFSFGNARSALYSLAESASSHVLCCLQLPANIHSETQSTRSFSRGRGTIFKIDHVRTKLRALPQLSRISSYYVILTGKTLEIVVAPLLRRNRGFSTYQVEIEIGIGGRRSYQILSY